MFWSRSMFLTNPTPRLGLTMFLVVTLYSSGLDTGRSLSVSSTWHMSTRAELHVANTCPGDTWPLARPRVTRDMGRSLSVSDTWHMSTRAELHVANTCPGDTWPWARPRVTRASGTWYTGHCDH